MTQRIFDIENEKDMADLWNILPDEIYEIRKGGGDSELDNTFFFKNGYVSTVLISINWHDKTEIIRPVDYESMIGCIGWFWDSSECSKVIGILTKYEGKRTIEPFCRNEAAHYASFRPAKKSELKFWGE